MKTSFRLALSLLFLGSPAMLAAQSVQDFQLPPNPTPTETPAVQGPVDQEGGVPSRPQIIATPTPSPTPRATETQETGDVGEEAQPSAAGPRPERQPPRRAAERPPSPLLPDETEAEAEALPELSVPDTSAQVPPPAETPEQGVSTPDEQSSWLWPAIGGGLLASFALGFLFAGRRREVTPPQIERPQVGGTSPIAPVNALTIRAEPIKLTRSVMNATLHYRLVLTNRSDSAVGAAELGVDMIGAHGSAPVEEQVASSAHRLEKRHVFDRIAPGQAARYEGQLAVPLAQARVIMQGNAALFIPLLRVRVDGVADEPVLKTFVVGQGAGNGGRVMPFRLDEGPRSYEPVAARALD